MNHPDPKRHLQVSIAKSVIRIIGYVALGFAIGNEFGAITASLLVLSEAVGIVEELV